MEITCLCNKHYGLTRKDKSAVKQTLSLSKYYELNSSL